MNRILIKTIESPFLADMVICFPAKNGGRSDSGLQSNGPYCFVDSIAEINL